ncbi:tetratricopeptide repeat-containing sensor histidine kinase [Winogradskyella thalassocola]|uniref:Tetratricopeptide repeat-containing protein n=1 Tax=Winogradskyella thalassocola TaxID=262004 RepID=A0A1G8B586_9FLAO|nr:histidine kinase [Winogradskyella thalassocola]SDH28346.1 Tetratricopeptide repeat-containing protein [Winogradskyella thalassocola]
MKKPLIIIFLILSTFCFSQNKMLDSLENVILNYKKQDTNYVNLRIKYTARKMFLTPADTTWTSYVTKTLNLSKQLEYPKGIAISYNNLGIINHYFLSDPLEGLNYYQKSYAIFEKEQKFKRYEVGVLTNIGLINYEQQDYDKALKSFKTLLVNPENKSKFSTEFYIGNIYGDQKQLDSSIYYYKKALLGAEQNKNTIFIANIKTNLSIVQANAGLLEDALTSTNESLDLIEKHNIEGLRVTAYTNAAEVYLQNNDIEKAEHYATNSLKLNEGLNSLSTENSALETLANVYAQKGDYKNALLTYQKHIVLRDSLINTDRKLEISRKEIQYEADKHRAISEVEIERQKSIKNASLIGGSGLVLASLIGFVLYRRKQDAVSKSKEAEFNAKVSDTELKALRSQMNPHFIFNSLNSIGDYILKNDTQSASDYLSKFAKLMRLTLENSEKKEILLSDDISLLRTYMDIERKRFNHKFEYTIDVSTELDAENILVPPMILQPFIENSIIHGLSQKDNLGLVKISFKSVNNMLICSVDDNGIGRKNVTSSENKTSMGMAITKSRIEIINKLKNTNGTVEIIDKTEGTRIDVSLPMQFAF